MAPYGIDAMAQTLIQLMHSQFNHWKYFRYLGSNKEIVLSATQGHLLAPDPSILVYTMREGAAHVYVGTDDALTYPLLAILRGASIDNTPVEIDYSQLRCLWSTAHLHA